MPQVGPAQSQGAANRRPSLSWLVSAVGMGCVPLLLAWHGVWAFGLADGPASALLLVAGLALGALLVDGVTGLVHWACDTWGDEAVPILGPGLIHDFREHHLQPEAMLAHDAVVVNREPALSALALLALASTPAARAVLEANLLLYGAVLATAGYGAIANQLHYWAHAPRPPGWVRGLQRSRLILSPAAHARHHARPNTEAYCISTGWLNPLLDAAGFWRGLEAGVTRLTGAQPRR